MYNTDSGNEQNKQFNYTKQTTTIIRNPKERSRKNEKDNDRLRFRLINTIQLNKNYKIPIQSKTAVPDRRRREKTSEIEMGTERCIYLVL